MNIDELEKLFIFFFKVKKKNVKKLNMKTFSKWDSLNHIKLISNIENKYKIKMTNKEISQATTFEKIYNVLNKRIKRSQG